MKTSVFLRFFAYFTESLCAWQCIWRLPKSISFYREKGLISEPRATKMHPKAAPNPYKCKGRGQEQLKNDFGGPKNRFVHLKWRFEDQEADFGGQNKGGSFPMLILEREQWNGGGL